MESIDPECTKLKQKYEACFNTWYSEKFLKGETQDECQELFKEYRTCLEVFFVYAVGLRSAEDAKGQENRPAARGALSHLCQEGRGEGRGLSPPWTAEGRRLSSNTILYIKQTQLYPSLHSTLLEPTSGFGG